MSDSSTGFRGAEIAERCLGQPADSMASPDVGHEPPRRVVRSLVTVPRSRGARVTADAEAARPAVAGLSGCEGVGVVTGPDDGDDRRVAPRFPTGLIPAITGVRLSSFGGEASLVNISTSGAAMTCGIGLRLGTPVTLVLEGTFSPSAITGRVVRCAVATLQSGVISYCTGVAFNEPISLDGVVVVRNDALKQGLPRKALVMPVIWSNRW
jgi:hypothetical protein